MHSLFLAPLLAFSVPASAVEIDFCSALAGLKAEAAASQLPQRIGLIKDEEFAFSCSRKGSIPAQVQFCRSTIGAVSMEFTHGFPWAVHDCLERQGVQPVFELADRYTGLVNRKRIVHLWGAWADGTRVDLRFEPTGDFSDEAEFKDYWGVYRLVVWHP